MKSFGAAAADAGRQAYEADSKMLQQKDEAERLRLGVRGGWIPIQEAITWADRQIERTTQPHPALVELALAHNRSREQVGALLGAVPGSADMPLVMRWCLGDLLAAVERNPGLASAAARWIESAALRGDLPKPHFGVEALSLADNFALAEQGTYGAVDEATERLLAFLRQHVMREA